MSVFYFVIASILIIVLQIFKARWKITLLIILGILGFLFLFLNFNAPVNTFTNADKHVLSVEAIEFNNKLDLYHKSDFLINKDTMSFSDLENDHSINGINFGGLSIFNGKSPYIELYNFANPLYFKTKEGYELKNIIGDIITKNVLFSFNDGSSLNFLMNNSYPYFSVVVSSSKFEIEYELDLINSKNVKSKALSYGYPLSEYIFDNISIKNLEGQEIDNYQYLKNVVDNINGVNLLRKIKGDASSDYVLSGRLDLNLIKHIEIDGKEIDLINNDFKFAINEPITDISLSFNRLRPESYKLVNGREGLDEGFLRLEYDFIKWFPLYSNRSEDEVRIFFTSNPITVVKTVFNKGIHFQGNKNKNSESTFDASLSYKQGRSQNALDIEIIDHNINNGTNNQIKGVIDQEFKLETKLNQSNSGDRIYRTFKVIDVEKKSEFKPLVLYAVYVFIFLSLALLIGFRLNKNTEIDNLYTQVFPPLASTILVFITIKLFLLWRSTVFLPISDLSDSIYNNLNSSNYLYRNTLIPYLLFLIIGFSRKLGLKNKVTLPSSSLLYFYLFTVILLGWRLANLHLLIPISDRLTAIYFPLLAFFISYYLILCSSMGVKIKNYFVVFTGTLFSVFFIYSDTGFAIIFILFFLLAQIILSLNFKAGIDRKSNRRFGNQVWIYLLALVFVILGFTYFTSYVFKYLKYFIIFISVIFGFIGFVLIFLKKNQTKEFLHEFIKLLPAVAIKFPDKIVQYLRYTIFLGLMLPSISMIIFSDVLSEKISNEYVHIKYRAQSLTEPLQTIIENEEFGTYNARKIVETATNKWFLSYFLNKGENINFLSFNKPFTLQKHFKHGVTYTTQSTDVMVSRYLIGEHGWPIPILLSIILLIISVYLLVNSSKSQHDTKKILKSLISVLGIIFLSVLAFFVNLTVTNKFIFFGQDFPLLSIQSLLSSIIFFSFFAAVFTWFIPKRRLVSNTVISMWNPNNNNQGSINYKKVNLSVALLIILLFVAIPYFIYNKFHKITYEDTFNLGHVFTNISKDFEDVNSKLALVQLDSSRFYDNINRLYDLFEDIELDAKSNTYSLTLYQKLKDQIKIIDTKDLYQINASGKLGPLVIKKKRGEIIEVKIQNSFYDLPSPDAFEKQWKGSLVAKNIDNASSIIDISDLDNIETVSHKTQRQFEIDEAALNIKINVMPASWFYNEKYDVIVTDLNSGTVGGTTGRFSIQKANENVNNGKSLTTLATRLFNEDIINIEDINFKKQFFYSTDNIKYFAKNVWLNGDFNHFFTFEDQFMLGYNLVENLKSDADLEKNDQNIELGLDFELYGKLQDILDQNMLKAKEDIGGYSKYREVLDKMNANLILATGDGDIIAINDSKFKDPNLYLNPNDAESISRTRLKLLSNFSSDEEEKVFNNNNLMKLQTGPQSTIKPILWTALTSGYRLAWENLVYLPPINLGKFTDKNEDIITFLPPNYNINLSSANPKDPSDNRKYLVQSRNTFNTLVTFFGSYSEADFVDYRTQIFKKFDQDNEEFPSFRYEGSRYVFNLDKFKRGSSYSFTDNNSLFGIKLYDNFNFRTKFEDQENLKLMPFHKGRTSFVWVNPSFSGLLMGDRINPQLGISQIIAGAEPIYVTPIKMVEMYGKLFSGNKNYTLKLADFANQNIGKNFQYSFSPFNIHENWGSNENWYKFLGREIFNPLNQAALVGTASKINKDYPGFYIYAKTGTGGDQEKFRDEREIKIRNRHLAVIISKENLGENLSEEKLKNNKFIVIYFTLHNVNSDLYWNYKNMMIKEIMNSSKVKYYFNS